jgi:hypothetical protein
MPATRQISNFSSRSRPPQPDPEIMLRQPHIASNAKSLPPARHQGRRNAAPRVLSLARKYPQLSIEYRLCIWIFLLTCDYRSISPSPLTVSWDLSCLLDDFSKAAVKEGTATMTMKSGEQWHCTNPACHCEVLVSSKNTIDGSDPPCVCRAPMKKNYLSPNLAYLEFLRTADPVAVREGPRKG